MRQEPFDKKGSWQPAPSEQDCSIHFADGLATDENPIPTVFLGYGSKQKKSRRALFRKLLEKNVRGYITPVTSTSQEEEVPLQASFIDENLDINMEELNKPMKVILEPMKVIPGGHLYCFPNNSTSCYACQDKSNLVKALVSKINKSTFESKQLKHRSIMKTSKFTWKKIKTDVKMKFYTAINTIVLFNEIFRLKQSFLSALVYWNKPKHEKKKKKKKAKSGIEDLMSLRNCVSLISFCSH